ncbi:MAG: hypothetical protein EKK64_06765 [Neisseriaceae bacterium]|nr:MAG: hypothetical protein EKK64_06765 [Neisseriaceae bacterium]
MYCLTYKILSHDSNFFFFKSWKKKGELNPIFYFHRRRIGQPCYESHNGTIQWYYYGSQYDVVKTIFSTEIRRVTNTSDEFNFNSYADHPSVIYNNGTKEWHSFGELHRESKPAIEYSNGDKEWWYYGKRHRVDGPAVVCGNKQYFYVNGEFVREENVSI